MKQRPLQHDYWFKQRCIVSSLLSQNFKEPFRVIFLGKHQGGLQGVFCLLSCNMDLQEKVPKLSDIVPIGDT